MAEATATATATAGGRAASTTVTETVTIEPENRSLTIKLRKRKPDKKVEWSSDTVDNEHLGRRSSKCCCIYEKPRAFGESSTESEDEEDEGCGNAHCIRGHRKGEHGGRGGGGSGGGRGSPRKAEPPGQDHAAAMQH
ncbi:ATP-binding cassette sub-family A member 12 [Platysternon megacephalum]|uniref:E3 ubiquitin-protein ligase PPP1R11 n=1 Tax=Platysternon megacephalum TaxID=55544 RepID=A0A4D9DI75_9SAUR|nr:ATP-binding cassette sub-family A member 12 [Platysternon megacephalum]